MTNEQLVARIQAGENVSENMSQLYDQVKFFLTLSALSPGSTGIAPSWTTWSKRGIWPYIRR